MKLENLNLDPTPIKATVSTGIGIGMGAATSLVEDVNLVLGFTPSEWTAFAAIAALTYSVLCILKFIGVWDWAVGLFKRKSNGN